MSVLQEGDSGQYVLLLQEGLNQLGAGLAQDGNFGPAVKAGVLEFQKAAGLTQDGVVGPITGAAIYAAVKGKNGPWLSPVGSIPSPVPPVVVGPIKPVPPPVSSGGSIYGCDIYHLDSVKSFDQMLAGGIEFLFCKASEGLSNDSKFEEYFAGAKAAGLIVGGYHFYNSSIDQKSQASHFAQRLKTVGLSATDLPPVFDFEKASGNFGSQDASNALEFLLEIQSLTGRLPLLYMSESTYSALGSPSWMRNYPWWLARYRSEDLGPGTDNWVFWQFAEAAHIPGLGNTGDKNKFRGSLDDLRNWISKT